MTPELFSAQGVIRCKWCAYSSPGRWKGERICGLRSQSQHFTTDHSYCSDAMPKMATVSPAEFARRREYHFMRALMSSSSVLPIPSDRDDHGESD